MQTPSAETIREYERRLNLAFEYMEDHLDEAVDVQSVARAASFSPYHFHRIFRAFTGETLIAYHRRLRLNRAAWQLMNRPDSMTDIAHSSGFSSSSDFARAFKRHFGVSPTHYRGQGGTSVGKPKTSPSPVGVRRRVYREASVVRLPALKLAYIRCKGLSKRFRSEEIRKAYATLYRWAQRNGWLAEPVRPVGIYPDSPEILAMGDCRYLACIAVTDAAAADGPIGVMTACEGKYVTLDFPRQSIFFPYRFFVMSSALYRHWIPEHGFIPSDAPVLEIYRNRGKRLVLHVPINVHHVANIRE